MSLRLYGESLLTINHATFYKITTKGAITTAVDAGGYDS
jgi:hypothetical protein